MDTNLFIRFSDLPKVIEVSPEDFFTASALAKKDNCLIADVHHLYGRTLYVGFSYSFFSQHSL